MQRMVAPVFTSAITFQSPPVPEHRCNTFTPSAADAAGMFQSPPVPEHRCNLCAYVILTVVVCFNPHRCRSTGATSLLWCRHSQTFWFQSPPVPEHRCNPGCYVAAGELDSVSIPTGAGAPVQHNFCYLPGATYNVSIPTGAGAPVQPRVPL